MASRSELLGQLSLKYARQFEWRTRRKMPSSYAWSTPWQQFLVRRRSQFFILCACPWENVVNEMLISLVPRGRAPFGQRREMRRKKNNKKRRTKKECQEAIKRLTLPLEPVKPDMYWRRWKCGATNSLYIYRRDRHKYHLFLNRAGK